MKADWPLVSIVFLAFNRREALAVSLQQVLEHLDYPADRLEVIVVDNASTDGTAEMVGERFPDVRVMRNVENVGMSGANGAMRTARGDWRLVLDDDCYIVGDALKTAVRRAQEHHADVVSFRVLSGEVPGYAFNDEYPTGLLSFWGCSAMFSPRASEMEPFYDPRIFIWANEMELTMRLLDRGYCHLYLPEVESVHMKGPSDAFAEHMVRINYRHWSYIAAKHLRAPDALAALGNLLLHVVLQALSEDRRAIRSLADVPRGFLKGLRYRSPVRPAVSRLYRCQSRHFLSPIPFLRSPLERIRSAGDPDRAEAARLARIAHWYERHRRYYPTAAGTLEL